MCALAKLQRVRMRALRVLLACTLNVASARVSGHNGTAGTAGTAAGEGEGKHGGKYVLHVVADDLGFDDVGWRNKQVLTPTLDALVADGVEIRDFYTYMMCAPARGALMSGRYPMRLGVYTENLAEWDLDKAVLLPAALKAGKGDLSWATHAIGKWHVGYACVH